MYTSSFVDDVMFAHNQRGKGDANRDYIRSDSPGGSTEATCDVYVFLNEMTPDLHL